MANRLCFFSSFFAQMMFSEAFVCPKGGGVSLSRGVSVQGVSVGGVCPGGSLSGGSLSRGGFCPGASLSERSLSRGVPVQ